MWQKLWKRERERGVADWQQQHPPKRQQQSKNSNAAASTRRGIKSDHGTTALQSEQDLNRLRYDAGKAEVPNHPSLLLLYAHFPFISFFFFFWCGTEADTETYEVCFFASQTLIWLGRHLILIGHMYNADRRPSLRQPKAEARYIMGSSASETVPCH